MKQMHGFPIRTAVSLLVVAAAATACFRDPEQAKRAAVAKGNEYLEARKFGEAIIEYRRAVQLDTRYGEARKRLAEAYLASGDVQNALREFARAADLLPDDPDVQLKAGNLLLAAGQFEDARSRADRVLAVHPSHAAAHVLRGNALAGLKDLEGALQELEEAAATNPNDGLIHSNIGVVHMARGARAEAEAAFRKATELSPNSVLARVSYANYLLAARRQDEAEAELKKALEAAPSDAIAHRALAVFYVATGRQAEAEPHLKKLAELSSDPSVRFALARFYAAANRRDEAMRELRTLAAVKDTYAEATLQMAALQYGSGQQAEGRRLLQEVLAAEPADARALLLNAQFLAREKKYAEAIAAAQAALGRDPRLVAAHFVLGVAHEGLRDIEAAKQAFSDVLRLEPNAVRAQLALSRLHLLSGEGELARQLAARAVTTAGRTPETQAALIKTLLANEDLAAAEAEIKAFRAEHPARADALVLEGTLHLLRRNLTAAERAFDQAIKLDPRSAPAASGRVQVLLASGRAQQARAYVSQLVTFNPESAEAHVLAARTYATLRDFAAAEPHLRKALDLEPTRTETYNMLGQLYVLQGQLDNALREFRTLAERRPKDVGIHTMVATLLHAQNRRKEAMDEYRRTLEIDANAAVAANNLAWMLAEDGDLDAALQLAQTAKAQMPDSPEVADTLGWIYYKKGLTSQAVAQLRESVQKQPRNAGFNYHLGLAYARNGDLTLARRTLETALKLDPKAQEAAEARAMLARLADLGS